MTFILAAVMSGIHLIDPNQLTGRPTHHHYKVEVSSSALYSAGHGFEPSPGDQLCQLTFLCLSPVCQSKCSDHIPPDS